MSFSKIVLHSAWALGMCALTACGGGGGSGGYYYDHSQLATEFVNHAYTDAGVNLTLVKTNTFQNGYIVVDNYGTFEAYYIDGWSVGVDISNYVNSGAANIYSGLDYIGANQYQDPYTGIVFEETTGSSKDLEKLAALKEEFNVQASAEHIKNQFGLSVERSHQVARLAVQLKNTPKASMTDADYDNFSKELIGSSITSVKAALQKQSQGDATDLNSLIAKAAQTNGVGPEHMSKIVNDLFQTGK